MRGMNRFVSLFSVAARKPKLRKWLWRHVYEFLAVVTDSNLVFMNYGYAPLSAEKDHLKLDPQDEPNRYGIELYLHLLDAVEVRDRRVLEVGCGRGGGSAYIRNHFSPCEVIAVDYSKRAVALCKERHRANGLMFLRRDAESLGFEDGRFDLVVNVESSHCYASMDTFLAEVVRVLRPGGCFLFADFRDASEIEKLCGQLERSGMSVLRRSDVTANIVAALTHDSGRRRALIRSKMRRSLWQPLEQFAGVAGSIIYESLCSGQVRYVSFVMQKERR